MKNLGGRPTKYRPEYAQKMIDFFNIEPSWVSKIITTGKNDYCKEEEKLMPSNLPTLEKFASDIDVNTDTLVEWASIKKSNGSLKYPKFSAAYSRCKQLQKNILVENGLNGLYQSNFAIFVAKNFTDMKDKTEQDVTSGGKPIPLLGGTTRVHTDDSNREDTPAK